MRLVVVGPTEGYPDHNAREYALAAERVFNNGHITPDGTPLLDGTPEEIIRARVADLLAPVLVGVGVVVLDGWESDRASRAVVDLAMALGMPVRTVYAWSTRIFTTRR